MPASPQRPAGNRAGHPARGALVIDPERSPDRGRCADAAPMSDWQTALGTLDSMPVRKGPGTAHFVNRDMTQRLVAPLLDFGGTPSMCVVVSIGETDGHHCFKLHGAQQRQAKSGRRMPPSIFPKTSRSGTTLGVIAESSSGVPDGGWVPFRIHCTMWS